MCSDVLLGPKLGLALTICVCLTGFVSSAPAASDGRVLLISLDGFRADYLDKTEMPNFQRLISNGVRAKFTFDAFITKTFPNHYTIVTGMYEETHGIVGNRMYDPLWNEYFALGQPSSLDAKWWDSGEPIWVTNQNNLGHSAVINWPGSDIAIRNEHPTYYLPKYNESIPFSVRVDWVIQHLKEENDYVNLGIMYFHEPDKTGHMYGPNSPEMIAMLQTLDEDVGYLIDQMESNGLYDTTNIIITSDHGMADVSVERVIELDNFVDSSLYDFDNNNPVIGIWPKDGDGTDIYNAFKNASEHMNVYRKDEIPQVFHYHDNRRIAPILLVAKEGWSIFQNLTAAFPNWNDTKYFKGAHGYDNRLEVMHPVFVAHGPVFNQNQSQADPFYNVDIYPLICYILDIPESPNNGSLSSISHILRSSPTILPTDPGNVSTNEPSMSVSPTSGQDRTPLSISAIVALSVAFGVGLLAAVIFTAMCLKQRTYRQAPCNYKPIIDTSLDMYDEDKDINDVVIQTSGPVDYNAYIANLKT